MATLQSPTASRSNAQAKQRQAAAAAVHLPEVAEPTYALTDSQKEILAMLEDKPQQVAEAVLEAASQGSGLDILFATVGATAMVAGAVMVFFFAAAGAVLLVLGAILCAVAFEHVALRDLDEVGEKTTEVAAAPTEL